MSKSKQAAGNLAAAVMTIAFPNGGILPTEITGGAERAVPAHEPVEVPLAYGQQLVGDRFAYIPDKTEVVEAKDALTQEQRRKLDQKLAGLREDLKKVTTDEHKARLTAEITEIEQQLV